MKALKYLSIFSIPLTVWFALNGYGWVTFLPIIYAFGFIPFLELLIKPSHENMSDMEEEVAKDDPTYDWVLYLVVPAQFFLLYTFFYSIQESSLLWYEQLGRTLSMGVACGVLGINVAHELGHRYTSHERFMSKMLLMTSLYMHFYIEHNKGHHKNVSTPEDPASAREGESLFLFWPRSIITGYISAWKIEYKRLKVKSTPFFSYQNEMLRVQIIQLLFVAAIFFLFGPVVLLYFFGAAVTGMLLLETVNYIEHYGLSRAVNDKGKYEAPQPVHSWNSDHLIGRILLFELSRHSDHHYRASRKYQILRYHEKSPQMPTGYPGMMVLALIPPVWFTIMRRAKRKFFEAYA